MKAKRATSASSPQAGANRPGVDTILAEVFGPDNAKSLFRDIIDRRAFVVRGDAAKVGRLVPGGFDPKIYQRAIERSFLRVKDFAFYALKHSGNITNPKAEQFPLRPEQVKSCFRRGFTIVTYRLDHAPAASFAARLKAAMGLAGPVEVEATMSPRGAGFQPHFDRAGSIYVQCVGRKRFLISPRPVAMWPRGSASLSPTGRVAYRDHAAQPWEETNPYDMGQLVEYVLRPGDIMYAPPGVLHATRALDDVTLNLNLALIPIGPLDLLTKVLEEQLFSKPEWRHLPAMTPTERTSGELSAPLARFMRARLKELNRVLARVEKDHTLEEQWFAALAEPGLQSSASIASSQPSSAGSIRQATRLRVSDALPAVRSRLGGGWMLHWGDKRVSGGANWSAFLERLLKTRGDFTAEEATRWRAGRPYPWAEVKGHLEVLTDLGVVERVGVTSS